MSPGDRGANRPWFPAPPSSGAVDSRARAELASPLSRAGIPTTGGQHEISLWQADPRTRLRADLRRAGEPDGRTPTALLAAGLHLGRAQGSAAQGKAAVR